MSKLKDVLQNLGGKVSVILLNKDKKPIRVVEADSKDGYLGEKFADGLRMKIELELPKSHPLTIFRVEKTDDDPKHCAELPGRYGTEGTVFYSQTMKISRAPSGYTVPDKFRNCLWVMVPGEYGAFRIGRMEVVSQDGKFFLSHEFLYEGQCYRDHRDVAVPRFTNVPELFYKEWPSLCDLLDERFREDTLHWLRDYVQPVALADFGLAPGQGRVIWWSPTSFGGFGCIATPEGNAQVHWTKIVSDERYKRLTPGAIVTVDELLPTEPELCSGFPLTAIGVHPVVVDVIAANAIAEIDPILALIGG
jgi:hypothetical protein